MIEKTVLNYLTEKLTNVPCVMEMPEDFDNPLVVIQKLGSGESNKIFSASFAVQSYGATLYDAAVLNEAVKAAMMDIDELDAVSSVSLDGDYPFNDERRKRYRYQAVFDIVHY